MKFIQGKPLEMQHLVFKGDQEHTTDTVHSIQYKTNRTLQDKSAQRSPLPSQDHFRICRVYKCLQRQLFQEP